MTLIKINNLNKIIVGKNKEISLLKDISLEINEGDFLGIKGESGAGKSTLLNIIAGLDNEISGEYFFNGKVISNFKEVELAEFRNKDIGIVFQDFFLINHYTVLKNVKLPLDYSNNANKLNIDKLFQDLNIEKLKNEKVINLSGGEKQRVAIARALINNPKVIVADEPTGALDSENSKNIMEILKDLNKKGKTIIIVSHDNIINNYCSKLITLKDGVIIS